MDHQQKNKDIIEPLLAMTTTSFVTNGDPHHHNHNKELDSTTNDVNASKMFNDRDKAITMDRQQEQSLLLLDSAQQQQLHNSHNDDVKMPNSTTTSEILTSDKMNVIPSSANSSNNTNIKNIVSSHHPFHHYHPTHHNRHQLVRQQTSLNTSSSATTNITTNTGKKSPKKIKGQITYQRPPDGGWGWMVVVASFVINLIADGVSLSFGVIYIELVDYFNESKSKTAWVGSLFLSIPLITGPIASALVDHFGCRKVTIAGSILAAVGFFFGQFSTCIEHLFFAFSLSGFGLALCYVTSIVSVAYWFDKRRSLATGLAVCGTGFGTFLFAPFIIYLLGEYNWRGTLLILSAVFLHMVCCGFLIRDLNIDTSSAASSSSTSSSSSNSENTSDLESNLSDLVDEADDLESEDDRHHSPTIGLQEERQHHLLKQQHVRPRPLSECIGTDDPFPRHTTSLISIPTFIKNNNDHNEDQNNNKNGSLTNEIFGELTFRRGGYLHNLICYYPHLLSMFLPWDMQCDDLTVKTKVKFQQSQAQSIISPSLLQPPKSSHQRVVEFGSTHHMDSNLRLNGQLNGDSLRQINEVQLKLPTRNNSTTNRFGQLLNFARQSNNQTQNDQFLNSQQQQPRGNRLHNLRLPRGSLTYRSAMLVINKYRLKASSAPDIYRTSMATINEEKSFTFLHNLKEILMDMVDLSNFKSVRYTIFCLSNFLLYACIDVPYVYIPDQVITSGASDKEGASKYISIIGVFNTFGVVFVGYIGDKPWLDASFIYAILVSISGLAIATIPLTTKNYVIVIQSAIYGFSISANYSLVSVILVELISLDSFTTAYGMLLLVQGFGSLVGPPLAGWVYDVSGNYDNAFYITGITILLSGLMVIPVGKKKNCFLWKPSSEEEITSVLANGGSTFDVGSSQSSSNVMMKNYQNFNGSTLNDKMKHIKMMTIEKDSKI